MVRTLMGGSQGMKRPIISSGERSSLPGKIRPQTVPIGVGTKGSCWQKLFSDSNKMKGGGPNASHH